MCSGHLIWSSRCSSFQLDANKQSKPVVFAHANYVGYMRICVCCPCQVKTYPQELWKDIEDDLYDSEDKGSHNQILTRLLSHLEEWPEMDRIRRHFFPFFLSVFHDFHDFFHWLPGLAGGTAEGSNRTETLNYCAETWQDSHRFT